MKRHGVLLGGGFVVAWTLVAVGQQSQTQTLARRIVVIPDCRIRPLEEVEVPAQVAGVLTEVLVKKYSAVKAGQIIARVDDRLAKIELRSKQIAKDDESGLLKAEAAEREQSAALEEATELRKRNVESDSRVRLKKAQLEVAQQNVNSEQEKRKLTIEQHEAAKTQVEMHLIRSPIGGVVVEVHKKTGEAVEAREKVMRVIRDDVVRVEGAVHALEAAHLQPGMAVEVTPNIALSSNLHYRHAAPVLAVKMLADGRHCASADQLGVIHVWNIASQSHERELRGHERPVHCLAASPTDPNLLVSAGDDKLIYVWDIAAGKSNPIATNGSPVLSAVLHPTQPELLITGHEDRKIRIWNLQTANEVPEKSPFDGHTSFVTSLAMTADGKYLVSAGNDRTVQIWDFDAGKPLYGAFRGRSLDVRQIGISPDGKAFLFSSDAALQLRAIADGGLVTTLESRSGPFNDVAVFAPGSGFVLTASTGKLELWRPQADGRPSSIVRTYEGHTAPIRCVDFAADGRFFVSASEDGTVRIWEAPTRKQIESERTRGVVVLHQSVDPASQMMSVYTEVTNPGNVLQPGRFATMVIYPIRELRQHAE